MSASQHVINALKLREQELTRVYDTPVVELTPDEIAQLPQQEQRWVYAHRSDVRLAASVLTANEAAAVERHNAYGWVRPDADACEICGRKAFNTPADGFSVRECFHCSRLVCEECADIDGGGGDDGSQLSGWTCAGDARAECERIAGEDARES